MNVTDAGRMDMGDIVAGGFGVYRRALPAWLAVTVIGSALAFAVQLGLPTLADSAEPTPAESVAALPWLAALLVVNLYTHAALIVAAVRRLREGRFSVGRAYLDGLRLFPAILFAAVVLALIVALLTVTLILIPVAIFVAVLGSFWVQVIVEEGERPLRALARSRRIVAGQWWRTLGISVAIALLSILPVFAVGVLATGSDAAWASALAATVGGALAAPFQALAQTLLYFDLRARKGERLAILLQGKPV